MTVEIKYLKLSEIKKNPDNPRVIKDEKFHQLKKSIQDFPEMLHLREIVVDENYMILGGNQRFKALQELKHTDVVAKIVSGLSEEQKKEFIVKDNVNVGDWDFDLLSDNYDSLQLNDWGVEIELEEKQEVFEDDFETVIPEDPITVLGDLYEIGEHRLLCGDSTNIDDVEKLMNGEKADIAFTSPPYNASKDSVFNGKVKGFNNKYLENNDEKTNEHYIRFLCEFTNICIMFSDYVFVNLQMLARNKRLIVDYQYKNIIYLIKLSSNHY